MIENVWADQAAIDELHAGVLKEVEEAVAWAEQSPYPDPSSLLEDVYESI